MLENRPEDALVSLVETVQTVETVETEETVETIDFLAEKNMLDCFIVPGGVDQEEPYHQV